MLSRGEQRLVRTDAEVIVVIDTSRSMLAASHPGAPSRFQRARAAARALRGKLLDVPVGLTSLTDRPLPHLFPSTSASAFYATLDQAVGVDKPAPRQTALRASSFSDLGGLGADNYFSSPTRRRAAIVLTDGEGQQSDPQHLRSLRRWLPLVDLFFVHFWSPNDRVFGPTGLPERDYQADSRSLEILRALDELPAVAAFPENELERVAGTVRATMGEGERESVPVTGRTQALAHYAVAGAFLPLGFVLWRRSRA